MIAPISIVRARFPLRSIFSDASKLRKQWRGATHKIPDFIFEVIDVSFPISETELRRDTCAAQADEQASDPVRKTIGFCARVPAACQHFDMAILVCTCFGLLLCRTHGIFLLVV